MLHTLVKRYVLWGGIAAVSVWAVVLRFYALAVPSYWLDEGYSVTIAQAIAHHGYPLLDSGTLIWRSPLYHYLLGGIVALFDTSEFVTRLPSVIIGLGAIGIMSYAAWCWFGPRVAGITFVLASFSTWEIAWSRQARMYMALQALFWLAVIVFERWNKTRQQFWLVPLAVVAALLTHQFALLLIIALPAYDVLRRHAQQPRRLLWYTAGLFLLLPVIIAMLHYGLHQPVPVNYWGHYLAFLWRDHAIMMILALFSLAAVQRASLPVIFWLSTIGLFGLGLFSFGITLLQYRYLFFLYPIILWLAAYTIAWLLSRRLKWLGLAATGVIGLLLIWHHEITLLPQIFWPLESDTKTSQFSYKSFTPQPDFRAGYDFIAQHISPDSSQAIVITPYPALARLYRQQDDTYALYLDVVGSIHQPTSPRETYTGVPYITLPRLKQLQNQHPFILLDYFSTRRIAPKLRDYIDRHGRVLYTKQTGPWSTVIVFEL